MLRVERLQGPRRSIGAGFERIQELEATNRELEDRIRTLEARPVPKRSLGSTGGLPTPTQHLPLRGCQGCWAHAATRHWGVAGRLQRDAQLEAVVCASRG